jgi:hypothetical protein
LGGFSPYRRQTTNAAYDEGAQLISEFDYMFASHGGMKPVLKALFSEQHRQTITVQYFQQFLQEQSGMDLTAVFNRYVYGQSFTDGVLTVASEKPADDGIMLRTAGSRHPRPFTKAELKALR